MTKTLPPLGCAIVGYGYWGPNIVRNLIESQDVQLLGVCEKSPTRAQEFSRRHPGFTCTSKLDELLRNPAVESVMIATPPQTHHALALRALQAGKHVMVEKPLAMTAAEAEDLIGQAEAFDRVLMPGHTFLYSPPVNKIRHLIQGGELGETYFVTSSRMNLGLYQKGGVILDLAPHDISILLYWLNSPVVQVSASAQCVFQSGIHETAFLTLTFAKGATANVQISWLAPRKVRQMVVVGSKRMVHYDDTAADEVVRVYDRGMEFERFERPSSFGEYKLTYRAGDMVAPHIQAAEPLALEIADFVRAIRTGEPPRSSAQLGLEVVRALEAAHASLRDRGRPIRLDLADHPWTSPSSAYSDETAAIA
jgi:predicted dehydrogenase